MTFEAVKFMAKAYQDKAYENINEILRLCNFDLLRATQIPVLECYGLIALRFQDFCRAIIQFKKLYHILLKKKREKEL